MRLLSRVYPDLLFTTGSEEVISSGIQPRVASPIVQPLADDVSNSDSSDDTKPDEGANVDGEDVDDVKYAGRARAEKSEAKEPVARPYAGQLIGTTTTTTAIKLQLSADCEPTVDYAILSHTWLPGEQDEVNYADIVSGAAEKATFAKPGATKVAFCLDQAEARGISSVWVDSCCINRDDKHELGKSINKMFQYYRKAAICFVYLTDVTYVGWRQELEQSRWFTRGWTLQELIAARNVSFYSVEGKFIGDKDSLSGELLSITGIDLRSDFKDSPISTRFRWSLKRETKEPEDMSYCLLGILEIRLLANYGEGAESARERLLEAVEKEHGKKAVREIGHALLASVQTRDTLTLDRVQSMLRFDFMNARRGTITDPFRDSCAWLLNHPDYQAWYAKHIQFLWIKGKAGSGKSTLMKHADLVSKSDTVHISFYFSARGAALEHTVEGMYRSLLHQLLEQVVSTQEPVQAYFHRERAYTATDSLGIDVLKGAFRTAILSLTESVHCFIDALDECDDKEAQSMIHFLEDVTFNSQLFICFASRYYPSVSIRSTELLLESQSAQSRSLQDYVYGRLNGDTRLKQEVIRKANGVFFWVVLVVKILNDEQKGGRAYNLFRKLQDLPSELNELLDKIANRCDRKAEFRLALQWILYAKKPLSARDYYMAVVTGLDRLKASDECYCPLSWTLSSDQWLDHTTFKNFVASTSRGLAELAMPSAPPGTSHHRLDLVWGYGKITVQFIHESVRDYLLLHGGLIAIMPQCSIDLRCWIQDELKSLCYRYLTTEVIREKMEKQLHDVLLTQPFVMYAISSVLQHAEDAAEVIAQDGFLQAFNQNSHAWVAQFRKSYARRGIPNFGMFRDQADVTATPLSPYADDYTQSSCEYPNVVDILVREGNCRLLAAAHRIGFDFKGMDNDLLFEVIERGQAEVVRVLLSCGMSAQAVRDASYHNIHQDAETPLIAAVRAKDADIVTILLEAGAEPDVSIGPYASPIMFAIAHGQVQILNCLLTLSKSLDPCHLADALLAVCSFTEYDLQRWKQQNALENHTQMARLLLNAGASPSAKDEDGQPAIVCAIKGPNTSLVTLLLERGAHTEETNEHGQTAMMIAIQQCKTGIIDLLISRGADIDAVDKTGRSVQYMLGFGTKLDDARWSSTYHIITARDYRWNGTLFEMCREKRKDRKGSVGGVESEDDPVRIPAFKRAKCNLETMIAGEKVATMGHSGGID